MTEGFSNPIIGGGGALVYPAIKSPNFNEATQTGWSIDKNGNAFFYGIVTGGEFAGVNFIINANGIFFYSGTPAFGNLVMSLAWVGGTDTFGNTYTSLSLGSIPGGFLSPGTVTGNQLASSVTARSLGGITTTISGTAPLAPKTGDIWIDSATGYQLNQWSGSAWVAITFTATDVIAAGTITASLIQAGTITASLLAAGIVVAGIVDSTTINAATFNGGTYEGTDFIINTSGAFFYSSTPASGNLIASIAQSSGTDGQGNAYVEGVASYEKLSATDFLAVSFQFGEVQFFSATSAAGPWTAGAQITPGYTTSGDLSLITSSASYIWLRAAAADYVIVQAANLTAGDPANTALPEVWRTASALGTNWTGSLFYRMLPDGDIEIAGHLTGSAPNSSATIFTLPAGYTIANTCFHPVLQTAGAYTNPAIDVSTAGVITFSSTAGSGSVSISVDGIRLPAGKP